jgi:hypothetical protein
MLHTGTWADFACPACYLARPRIDQAITATGHADAADAVTSLNPGPVKVGDVAGQHAGDGIPADVPGD